MAYYDEKKERRLQFYNVPLPLTIAQSEQEVDDRGYIRKAGVMSREMWPDAIERTCFDTWLDEFDVPQREEEVEALVKRLGDFEPETFARMLKESIGTERLFAIFVLGYITLPDMEILLTPFLHAPVRKERWASAIALGRWKKEPVFKVLQSLLLEEIGFHYPYDPEIDRTVLDAANKAEELFSDRNAWVRLVDPTIAEVWNKQREDEEEYRWFMLHRLTITRIFEAWEDLRVIPVLRQALHACQELEQQPECQAIPYSAVEYRSYFMEILRKALENAS